MLQTVPLDVIIRIMTYTSVLDVISLRQVCKLTQMASSQRTLWMQVLRGICAERKMFFPSFPITDMTLSQLEHATTAVHRFLRNMRHHFSVVSSRSLRPFSTRILSSFDSATESFNNVVLVPGGRFLLTSCKSHVRLWDIGFHSGALVNPCPIASIDVGFPLISRIAITQPSSNMHEILVLVMSKESHTSAHLSVFRISPPAQPLFTLVASAPVSFGHPFLVLFSERHVAVSADNHILLWNFAQDSWARWRDDEMSDDVFQITICNDNLIASMSNESEGQIKVMKLPSLSPRGADEDPVIKSIRPILQISIQPNSHLCAQNTAFGSFEITEEIPIHLDIQHDGQFNDADELTILHYVLKRIENGGKGGLPTCLPVLLGETRIQDVEMMWPSCLHWIKDETVQFTWINHDTIRTHISILPPCDDDDTPVTGYSGVLSAGCQVKSNNFSFCPFSGRLCLRMPIPGGHEVRILDYLPPA
ncbi:hypothetical protein B0H19DRAFT_1145161 [Mycena capillaripes]|nr:hypothetical protein B0H19DRAFT_1145161 [Mycena capillaripes]